MAFKKVDRAKPLTWGKAEGQIQKIEGKLLAVEDAWNENSSPVLEFDVDGKGTPESVKRVFAPTILVSVLCHETEVKDGVYLRDEYKNKLVRITWNGKADRPGKTPLHDFTIEVDDGK